MPTLIMITSFFFVVLSVPTYVVYLVAVFLSATYSLHSSNCETSSSQVRRPGNISLGFLPSPRFNFHASCQVGVLSVLISFILNSFQVQYISYSSLYHRPGPRTSFKQEISPAPRRFNMLAKAWTE